MDMEQKAAAVIQQPPLQKSRVSRIAGLVLMGAAIAFFGCIVAVLIGVAIRTQMFWILNCLSIGVLISAGVALLAALVRISASVFTESNVRLNELMATIFFAGTAATIALSFMPKYPNQDDRTGMSLVFIVISFVMTSIGSAWGWSIARRMAIISGTERMKMLAFGWMLTVGGFCGAWIIFFTIIWLTDRHALREEYSYVVGALLGSPLMIPAVNIEMKLRRKLAANQAL